MIRELFSARVYQGHYLPDETSRKAMRAAALDCHQRSNPHALPWSRGHSKNILTAPESAGVFDALAEQVHRVVRQHYDCTPGSMTAREVVVQNAQFVPLHVEATELSAIYWIDSQAQPQRTRQNYAGAFVLVNPSGAYGARKLPWEGWRSDLIHPHTGMLVVFPSYLAHHTHPYNGDSPSVEIHFEISLNPQDMQRNVHASS